MEQQQAAAAATAGETVAPDIAAEVLADFARDLRVLEQLNLVVVSHGLVLLTEAGVRRSRRA